MANDIDISAAGKEQLEILGGSLEKLVEACITLTAKLDETYGMVDQHLGPLLVSLDDKLDRLDGIMDALIDGAHSKNLTTRAKAIQVQEKIQEIFEIVDEDA